MNDELREQIERLIRQRQITYREAIERVTREVQQDVVKRGLPRSGIHFQLLNDGWAAELRVHVAQVLTDVLSLLGTLDKLTDESGAWLGERIAKEIGSLAAGLGTKLADKRRQLGTGSVEDQGMAQVRDSITSRARLQIATAIGEAKLKREARTPAPAPAPEPKRLEIDGFHPRVIGVAGRLFRDGHYRQAILDTYIALVQAVREKSGLGLDNSPLMQRAFSQKNPVLDVSDDPDEQLGLMWLYSGAVMGIRNPKAHRVIDQPDAQRALEWLGFASVLFRVLDEARVRNPGTAPGEAEH